MGKSKILIVEDEDKAALEIENSLQQLGYEVTAVVSTGEKAIKKAEQDTPDIVLVDIQSEGEMDGIEAINIIRSRFDIPVVFSLNDLDEERIKQAEVTMPFGYVLKPIREKDLRVAIEMALCGSTLDKKRKQTKKELQENVQFLESLEKANQIIHSSTDLDQMMQDFIEWVLELFECDRAWLLYPCDPNAPSFQIPIEACRPEFPGGNALNLTIPMSPQVQEDIVDILNSDGPITSGPGNEKAIFTDTYSEFRVQSQMFMSIHPRVGNVWMLGVHQCSFARVWNNYESRLFKEIGRRIEDGLSTLLYSRNLVESEEKYRHLVENNNEVIFSVDMDGHFTYISRAIEDITGYPPQEVLGNTFHQHVYPDDLPILTENFRHILAGNAKSIEYRIIDKAGKILWVSSHSSAVYHGDKVVGFSGITTNINERKQAEKALQENEFFFSQMFEQSSTSTCLYNPEGFVVKVNSEFCKMFGVDEKAIIDRGYNLFEDQAAKDAGIIPLTKRIFETKQANKWEFSFDIDLASSSTGKETSKAGKMYLEVFGYPILDDEGELQYVVLQHYNITEKRKTQEHLVQNEKMMSVGGLAAGMAHELNNPLGGIIQGTQNVLRRFSPDLKSNHQAAEDFGIDLENLQQYMQKREIHAFLNGILDSGKKASQIILSMLQFSRSSESRKSQVSIITLIENVLELAGKDYNLKKEYDFRNINITREFDADLPLMPCTETEIEQVILNLLNNASYAMADKKSDDPPQIILRVKDEKETLRIEVEDNGPGMDEETMKRVFEPFFTTKPVGKGTGLGLSVSYMIITNNHQGKMEIESEPGSGTKFIIQLPKDDGLTS